MIYMSMVGGSRTKEIARVIGVSKPAQSHTDVSDNVCVCFIYIYINIYCTHTHTHTVTHKRFRQCVEKRKVVWQRSPYQLKFGLSGSSSRSLSCRHGSQEYVTGKSRICDW